MSESQSTRSTRPRFSLFHLLSLTTIVAVGVAVTLAHRKRHELTQYRNSLQSMSSRMHHYRDGELTVNGMPSVADDFRSFQVFVPDDQEYELKLGIGDISEEEIPPVSGKIKIPAGQHRVTLYAGDSTSESYRYVVYLDGQPVIEKTMGSEWMPDGWSLASGLDWPTDPAMYPAPLQLSSKIYRQNYKPGGHHYFNGQSDDHVTRRGYRLWIDPVGRNWKPDSPFIGFQQSTWHPGIGLRDGMRLRLAASSPFHWTLIRPQLETIDPIWNMSAEFRYKDNTSLTDQTPSFSSWRMSDNAVSSKPITQSFDPTRTEQNLFLHAIHTYPDGLQPVVELKWDASRPNEVGIRLADTAANDALQSWSLCTREGTKHLWRELQLGERTITADKTAEVRDNKPVNSEIALDFPLDDAKEHWLRWQTNETLPLQVVERQQPAYVGLKLYQGLPVSFGIKVPTSLSPKCKVKIVAEDPSQQGMAFPGGAVFEEIRLDLDATVRDWIWLETKSLW